MHGWGQWYALAAITLIIGCYVCGRRGITWVVVAALCAAQAASTVAVAIQHDVRSWLADQVLIVFVVFVALAGAYRRLRHELALRGWSHARDAQLRERTRIATDIHDTLGHDLTLLSLQAASIQVTATEPEIRERAAAMRAGAADAIATVRRLVDLLGVERDTDVAAVIERASSAGMKIEIVGTLPGEPLAAQLVAEALSNAATHAPGEFVTIAFEGDRVELSNRLPIRSSEASDERAGTGLATLSARLTRAGGSLAVDTTSEHFRLIAKVPAGIDNGPESLAVDYDSRRKRARRVLTVTVLAPIVALAVLATGFYAWAAHDATIEPSTYHRLHVGMSEPDALALLPRRQSPIQFGPDHGPDCRHYTNGNYPLAYGSYEICFREGVVSALHDRTGGNP